MSSTNRSPKRGRSQKDKRHSKPSAARARVLKLAPDEQDEARELEFELDYQLSLTTAQRFEMMLRNSRLVAEELIRHGHRKPFEIIKRT